MDVKELKSLMEAYSEVYAPLDEAEQLDEVLTGSRKEKAQELIKSKQTPSGKAKPGQKEKIGLITRVAVGGPHKGLHTTYGGISPTSGKTAKGAKNIPLHGSGNKAARRAGKDVPDTRNVDEQLDIFDIVLEFLQVEGYAETLEEAEWLMANELDADDINAIVEASYSAEEVEQLDELSNRKMRAYIKKSQKSHEAINKKWDQGTATEKEKLKAIGHEEGQRRAYQKMDKRAGK